MFLSVNLPWHISITVHINNCKFWGGKSTNGGGFLLQLDDNDVQFSSRYAAYRLFSGSLIIYLTNLEFYNNFAAIGTGVCFGVRYKQFTEVPSAFIFDPELFQMTITSTIFHRNFRLVDIYQKNMTVL